ncbi:DUF1015 family protein [Pontibacter sp. G13]|uniref:DUF1015 domain-containing protein n=1 Tax=Pontibacter sp. G13 TaxID=3074898 RepID=UPI00288C1EC9|nr:DUF1015 family protein [Pontibacter sp. G13]WNJ19807.1 DUF1015 family protein [Pontibacter sp. G13]
MAVIKAFRGYRPLAERAKAVASRPYDVLNSQEARAEAAGNPDSFLHVVKPEIDLPEGHPPYDQAVYEKGRDNFRRMIEEGLFSQDERPSLYIYRQEMDGQGQSGLLAAAAVQDYVDGVIKKHELTRPDKEADRKNHVRVSRMNAEPVFFTYPAVAEIDAIVEEVEQGDPIYDFTAGDDIRHTLWVVDDADTVAQLEQLFADRVPATYVADGHHRTAAAALVGADLAAENDQHTGAEDYNFFMAVHFPDNQLRIIDYNRVVKDLNGLSESEFMDALSRSFDIASSDTAYKPDQLHTFGMYLNGKWYGLTAHNGTYDDSDPIGVLDVTILSKQILEPILGIQDLRTDKRIEFVGGIRGLGELEKRVDSGEMAVAFALYPVSMQQLIDIADSGFIMPPKTTWFEPKLRSGLVVYTFPE